MWFLSGRRHSEKAACKQQIEGTEEKKDEYNSLENPMENENKHIVFFIDSTSDDNSSLEALL